MEMVKNYGYNPQPLFDSLILLKGLLEEIDSDLEDFVGLIIDELKRANRVYKDETDLVNTVTDLIKSYYTLLGYNSWYENYKTMFDSQLEFILSIIFTNVLPKYLEDLKIKATYKCKPFKKHEASCPRCWRDEVVYLHIPGDDANNRPYIYPKLIAFFSKPFFKIKDGKIVCSDCGQDLTLTEVGSGYDVERQLTDEEVKTTIDEIIENVENELDGICGYEGRKRKKRDTRGEKSVCEILGGNPTPAKLKEYLCKQLVGECEYEESECGESLKDRLLLETIFNLYGWGVVSECNFASIGKIADIDPRIARALHNGCLNLYKISSDMKQIRPMSIEYRIKSKGRLVGKVTEAATDNAATNKGNNKKHNGINDIVGVRIIYQDRNDPGGDNGSALECIEYTVNGKLWTIKSYTKKGITHLTAFLTTGHIGSIQLMSAQEFMQLEKSKPHPQYVKEQEEHRNSLTLYKRLFPIVGLLINGPH